MVGRAILMILLVHGASAHAENGVTVLVDALADRKTDFRLVVLALTAHTWS